MENNHSIHQKERRVVVERRATHQLYPCAMHEIFTKSIEKDFKAGEDRMQRLESGISALLGGQTQQSFEIQKLQGALGDGVVKDIRNLTMCVESIKDEFTASYKISKEKFEEFDDFRWFRVWANKIKDKAIIWVLTFAFIGGAFVSVLGLLAYVLWQLLKQFS